ncbi:hypothetical protein BDW62DRAFT_191261 [Aspergillus aurantiobrunneus]
MSFLTSSAHIFSDGIKIAQTTLNEGAKIAAAYGKPALNNSAGFATQAAGWANENRLLAATTVVGGAVALVPGLVVAPALSALGFGAGGVQACSVAAGTHSAIGNVAAGSAFATMQSAGAGGAGLAVVNGVAQAGAATVSFGSAGLAWVKARL